MKTVANIFAVLKNKYLIALVSFVVFMLFFDHNDVFVQMDRKKQLNDLLAQRKFYQSETAKTKKELDEMETSPASLEKYARENFFMKRDNEDVFIVDSPADSSAAKK